MNERNIGYFIKNINDKLKAKANEDFKDLELTFSQSRVLAVLNSRGGRATQKEIEDSLEVSHPTVVGIVNRMVQNGHLICWFDENDRRNKVVQMTEKSIAACRKLDQKIAEDEKQMLASLSEAEIEILKNALTKIYQALK